MQTILNHPANARIIRSLCRNNGVSATILAPDAVRDPYLKCGSHPDIVERVWDQLGGDLPQTSRRILCGTPVLVSHKTGLIVAVCYGTQYCLRLPPGTLPAALQAGCQTSQTWSDDRFTDLSQEFGPDCVFGCWAKEEAEWCRAVLASEKGA